MSITQQQVISLLENVLFESTTLAQATAASWQANAAATDASSLAAAMAATGEEKIAATVVGYYLAALGRTPTAAEVRYYVAIAEQGLSSAQIAAGQVSSASWDTIASYFSHSAEFQARAGLDNGLNATGALLEAVPWLYESVLGRSAGTVEISYYDNQVLAGASLATLFREFTASPEFHTDVDNQIAAALAEYGTAAVAGDAPATVGANVVLGPPHAAPPPSAPTPSFGIFTTATDTIDDHTLAGTHTYTATLGTGATLNTGDSLTGNGLATLAITDSDTGGDATLPSISLSGVHAISITSTENVGDSTTSFSLVGISGITSLTITASGTNGDYISAASAVDVTAATTSAVFSLSGAHSLHLTDNALTTLDLTGAIANGVTLTDPTGSTSLTLDLETATTGFTDASNRVTDLTITSTSGGGTITAITDTALTHLTVTGSFVGLGTSATPVSLGATVTNLDMSGDTDTGGTNYITLHANGATVILGDDDSIITDASTGTGSTFTFGTGNNSLDLTSAATHANTVIHVGTDGAYDAANPAPNLILYDADSTVAIHLSTTVSTLSASAAGSLANMITAAVALGAGTALYGTVGTADTYIVETASASPSPSDITIIELIGGHAPSLSGGEILVG